jgi:hypothetical protein
MEMDMKHTEPETDIHIQERRWSDTYTMNKHAHEFRVFRAWGNLKGALEKLAREFTEREDGEGGQDKMYWMTAGPEMFSDNQPYVFGTRGKRTYILKKREMGSRLMLEGIAEAILRQVNVRIPEGYTPFTVICKYKQGQGVFWHKDNDYVSEVGTIVSMSLLGESIFTVELQGRQFNIPLEAGDIVVFDRSIRHTAGPASTPERINATTRYAEEKGKGVFIWPSWYVDPQGTGIANEVGRCNTPPSQDTGRARGFKVVVKRNELPPQ